VADKKPLKDPKGGLTAAGRAKYKRETGSNLKAGVKGAADTPQKMRRKGSFLTRFFTNPSGPMVKPNGEPSRLALSAHAWGEPVPKNRSDAAKLAAKGRRLLDRYEKIKKYNTNHDNLGRFSSSGGSIVNTIDANSRIVTGKDGIPMKMGTPSAELAQFHGIHKNWQTVRAIAPSRREKIAKIYESTPSAITPEAKGSWDYTAREIDKQYETLTKKLGVKVEFVNEDPYSDFFAMAKDFRENKRLKVLKTEATGGHPYWSNSTNDKFRAVHDAWGHLATGRGFDRHGEEAAYQAHKSMFKPEAYPCLATELRAQNAYLIQRGKFGDQKVLILPESLQKAIVVGMIAKASSINAAQHQSDLDNLTHIGGTHHASNGRNFTKKVSKEEPTSSAVHQDTIMNNQKRSRKRKKKSVMLSNVVVKTKKLKNQVK